MLNTPSGWMDHYQHKNKPSLPDSKFWLLLCTVLSFRSAGDHIKLLSTKNKINLITFFILLEYNL